MSDELGAVLIAEIGSVTTRVVLVDDVDGESRMICQVEKPSSLEPPFHNATIAILEAAARIGELTGRRLLNEGQLLMPQTRERDGVNHVVAATSAAGTLSLIIAAIATDISARSAAHACRCTYTSLLQTIALDDFDKLLDDHGMPRLSATAGSASTNGKKKAGKQAGKQARAMRAGNAMSWMERQIQSMLSYEPHAVVIAGGLEGGNVETLKRLAHMVALTTLRTTVDASGQQRRNTSDHPIIFAGNSAARDTVQDVLAARAHLVVVDNVRPELEREHLEPTQRELARLYQERILPTLPGYAVLQRLSRAPLQTVVDAHSLMSRFLAERYRRQVLTLDVGSSASSALLAQPGGKIHTVVLGASGSGFGCANVLAERGAERIARWLPFAIGDKELRHWVLNKMLRPHVVPGSREDLLLEHAVVREALALLREALADECHTLRYDMVVACGGVLAHAPPGLAALTLLDALQPTAEESVMAVDLHLDTLGLLAACGTVVGLEADAAVTLFERDVMHNMPLATCVVTLGDGKAGRQAVQAVLTPLRGAPQTIDVKHGQVARLPLPPGERAQLTLRPASGVSIGRNAPGVEVSTDVAAIGGSALGIIIDARGRPLRLPEKADARRALLWEWLAALDVVQGISPYLTDAAPIVARISDTALPASALAADDGLVSDSDADAVPPETHAEPPAAGEAPAGVPASGGRISLADLDQSGMPPRPASSLDNDLASLRQTMGVEEPPDKKKRGKKKKK